MTEKSVFTKSRAVHGRARSISKFACWRRARSKHCVVEPLSLKVGFGTALGAHRPGWDD